MKPQIIKVPGGAEMVIIPKTDYEELLEAAGEALEDAADVAMFDSRMDDLSKNKSGALPVEVSAAMLKGDTLLKALRKMRDLTQSEVAEAAGIRQGYYSEIEKGSRRGSVAVLTDIAKALNIPKEWLA